MRPLSALLASFVLAACASLQSAPASRAHADAFFAALSELCGQAYEGRMVSTDPADEGSAFATERLVMHVRDCSADEIRIPLHVGADRSRVWVVTRTEAGLRLKHDHRHEDGTPDAVTNYGGDSDAASGTPNAQDFPVDEESIALFEREGLSASVTNVWRLEISPGETFVYQLSRPNRIFRAAFDLTAPVEAPGPPWADAAAE